MVKKGKSIDIKKNIYLSIIPSLLTIFMIFKIFELINNLNYNNDVHMGMSGIGDAFLSLGILISFIVIVTILTIIWLSNRFRIFVIILEILIFIYFLMGFIISIFF